MLSMSYVFSCMVDNHSGRLDLSNTDVTLIIVKTQVLYVQLCHLSGNEHSGSLPLTEQLDKSKVLLRIVILEKNRICTITDFLGVGLLMTFYDSNCISYYRYVGNFHLLLIILQ